MLPANNPAQYLFDSIQHAKQALSPLELGLRKVAKDFENFRAVKMNIHSHTNDNMSEICYLNQVNSQCIATDQRKKGLSIKLSVRKFMEMLPQRNVKEQLHKKLKESKDEEVNILSKFLLGAIFDHLMQNRQQEEGESYCCDSSLFPPLVNHFDHLKAITTVFEGKRKDNDRFLKNLKFAKIGGFRSSVIATTSLLNTTIPEEHGGNSPPKNPRNSTSEAVSAERSAGSVLKSALAGGLSCAFSTALMHPIDTIKTHVQASTLSFPEIISKIPEIGAGGLYKGATPSIIGQFFGHGFRTGFFEASKMVLINVSPSLANRETESVLSFCSAVLGTISRVPSEVVKQRLQAGVFSNLGEAIIGTWQQEGFKGFFRGTGATLCREVPFYVAGLGLYTESKKAVQRIIGRELEPWETIAVGAITGGLTAVSTTPFDVIKTRMMISTQGQPVSMYMVALSILTQDGPLGLFKGAVPRFFWVAPLGAINFAGYELARKAMG